MSGYTEDYLKNKLTDKLNADFVVSKIEKEKKFIKSSTNCCREIYDDFFCQ